MLLSEFFKEHDNWRDILTNKPYCINISEDDKYILLKYKEESIMKTIVKKEIKQYVNEEIEITGATLLSVEEAEKLPLKLREYDNCWWLMSRGDRFNFAISVYNDGSVGEYGDFVNRSNHMVRPALKIKNLNFSNLQIEDVFEFGGKTFKIISDNLAFCVTDIGEHCFREDWEAKDANEYENSDVKKYVNDWFNGAAKEIADVTIK